MCNSDKVLVYLAGFGVALMLVGVLMVVMDGKHEIVVKVCECDCKKVKLQNPKKECDV